MLIFIVTRMNRMKLQRLQVVLTFLLAYAGRSWPRPVYNLKQENLNQTCVLFLLLSSQFSSAKRYQAAEFHHSEVLVNHLVACVWYAIGNFAPWLQMAAVCSGDFQQLRLSRGEQTPSSHGRIR